MIRSRPKRVPKNEIFRYYKIERDPDPMRRVFPSEFEIEEGMEDEWN
jgi:hypothetical protein